MQSPDKSMFDVFQIASYTGFSKWIPYFQKNYVPFRHVFDVIIQLEDLILYGTMWNI